MTDNASHHSEERILWRLEDGDSNRDYVTSLEKAGDLWIANYAFGAHGVTPRVGTPMKKGPASYEVARKAYDAMVKERLRKEYVPQGAPGAALVASLLADHARPAYVPVVAPSSNHGAGSRYFGKPWMPAAMKWPTQFGEPMDFVLQLDTASLPDPGFLPGREYGLLLFFHGRTYDEENQSLVVLVDPRAKCGARATPSGVRENSGLDIVSWRKVLDYPWDDDCHGIDFFDNYGDLPEAMGEDTIGMLVGTDGKQHSEAEAIENGIPSMCHSYECDKLGGWPRWEQASETPNDRKGNAMRFLLQVGFEGLIAGDLGDADAIEWPTWGRGQIFTSDATGEFTYVWACD